MRKRLGIGTAAIGVAAGAAVVTAALIGGPGAETASGAQALPAFGSCGQALDYAQRQALRLVTPWGLGGPAIAFAEEGAVAAPAAEADTGAADSAASPVGSNEAGTNVQEAGVDEPDIVKTDGGIVFAVAQGELQVVDASGAEPQLVASMPLAEGGFGHQLLLHGDRLLVVSSGGFYAEPLPADVATDVMPYPATPQTFLTEVDVSNPAAPSVVRTLTVEANYVAGRLTGSTARVVLSSQPSGIEFTYPQSDDPDALAAAEEANRDAIRRTTLADWLPRYRVRGADGAESAARPLVPCDEVRRPRQFAGLGALTVLTIDLERGVEPVDSDAVMTSGQWVYASPTGLYVATQQWVDGPTPAAPDVAPPPVTTAIHKFDVSTPGVTDYRASGRVSGYLLNQWSMSEHEGSLRVVSTEAPLWWGGAEEMADSSSTLSVLAEDGGSLAKVGELGGLGRGERVYGVRFIGELGYVVTFRQIDPLHVVDVSDPANPRLRGELKIPGYSAYLHPIGDGLLLGIGQDADLEGRAQGAQVSIFDVSDPASPSRIHAHGLGQGWTSAEYDHHAFLYRPETGYAVLPLDTYSVEGGKESYWSGAVVLRVGRDGIAELARVEHESLPVEPVPLPEPVPEETEPGAGGGSSGSSGASTGTEPVPLPEPVAYPTPILRSLVVGGSLLTVSEAGLRATSLETLGDLAWVAF
jgi:hypothetical protein